MTTTRLLFVAGAFAALSACSDTKKNPASSQPSPNASILPAPLAAPSELAATSPPALKEGILADSAGRLIVREPPPPPPEAAPVDKRLPEDTLTAKDTQGYSLQAEFRWNDLPAPAGVPEASAAAIREAGQKTNLSVAVDLGAVGRLRFALESPVFPLPAHSELRARTNYYGHVLAWPDGTAYRVLLPGALRAMFAERRADVSPLLRAKVGNAGAGTLLGHKTVKSTIETSLGTLALEQTILAGSGGGGELLCRLLVELVGAEPTTEACRAERIPLSAQYRWATGGSIGFVVTNLVEKKELPLGYLYVPPAGAVFTPGELPPSSAPVFLDRGDLAKFRTRPTTPEGQASPRAPGEGITAGNQTGMLQYLLVDGVPVAWVRPKTEQYVIGPMRGHYSIAWRDFFGSQITPPSVVEVPAFVRVGAAEGDAGARP